MSDSATPPGWRYNPSAWRQRVPILALAAGGGAIASYLALYQVRLVPEIWEPLFGAGSREVLNSPLSRVLPIPDAALGAFGYLLDAMTGAIGGRGRWRTMPWMVILFGLAVGLLGVVSVLLVIAQPVLLGHWCTLCLIAAMIALQMIGPAMDEVLASLQHVTRQWAAATRCGGCSGMEAGYPPPIGGRRCAAWGDPERSGAMLAQLVTILLGVMLTTSPALLGHAGEVAALAHVLGPLVVSVAIMASWEVLRGLRWLNLLLGLVLAAGSLLVSVEPPRRYVLSVS